MSRFRRNHVSKQKIIILIFSFASLHGLKYLYFFSSKKKKIKLYGVYSSTSCSLFLNKKINKSCIPERYLRYDRTGNLSRCIYLISRFNARIMLVVICKHLYDASAYVPLFYYSSIGEESRRNACNTNFHNSWPQIRHASLVTFYSK